KGAIEWTKRAMRLTPSPPARFGTHRGRALFAARRYAEASDAFRRISRPDQFHYAFLAACSAMLGDQASAAGHVRSVLALEPKFSVEAYLRTLHYQLDSDREHHREALLRAELPA